jgi:predicted NBD/HSP70 family sugar kinase
MGDTVFSTLQENSLRVFSLIQKYGPVAKTELCAMLDKKMTPVNRMITPLEEGSLVIAHGKGDSTGGRKPVLYDVDPNHYRMGAVNISSTYCEVAVMNLKMEILQIERFAMTSLDLPEAVIDRIAGLLEDHIKSLGIERSRMLGVGLTVFSSFDAGSGRLARPIMLFVNERWLQVPVAAMLAQACSMAVVMEKGTNAAAQLEYLYGAGKQSKRMLYILCAMNIRSAVIFEGRIISTAVNYEDAFGHMTVDMDGERCECGNYGCVATYTSIPAMLKNLAAEIKKGRSCSIPKLPDDILFKDLCEAVEHGDVLAKEVVSRSASVMGTAMANYINLFAPDLIILSGLVIRDCSLYYDVAVETAHRKTELLRKNGMTRFEKFGAFQSPITAGAGSVLIERLLHGES